MTCCAAVGRCADGPPTVRRRPPIIARWLKSKLHWSTNMANEPDSALTGAAFELANAGYRPMADPDQKNDEEAIGSDSASLREAAERRSGPDDETVVRKYTDGEGRPIAMNEAVTLD